MSTDLIGKGVVVTGGGRGIGAAVARALGGAGAAVVVAARSRDQIDAVAEALRAAGGRAEAVVCDVTDPASVGALAEAAARELGAVDILVNNAGVASSAPIPELTIEEWDRVFAINARGPFLCTRALLPAMIERGWGRVVNVASVAALAGARYIAAYAASKHALLGFTRCVADEVGGTGVTVNAVCPGYVDTPMVDAARQRIRRKTGRTDDDVLRALLATTGQDRLIDPAEVASAVLRLCGDGAAEVNGEAIVVDGSWSAG